MTVLWLVVGLVVGLAVGAGGLTAVGRGRAGAVEERARRAESDADAARTRAGEAERSATEARAAADAERRRADEAVTRVASAEAETARAQLRAATAEDELAAAPIGAVDTAWALTGLRVAWGQRALDPLAPALDRVDLVVGAEAEVQRIREEIGTPGTLRTEGLDGLSAATALVGLLGVEGVLAALVRRTQAFDLALGIEGAHLVAEVACEGDDDVRPGDADLMALVAALVPAGADLGTRRRGDGVLVSRLRVPLS